MKPCWNALTTETQALYIRLSKLPVISEFYLAGGTGLAIQIGHRFSVDLDFFGDSPDAVGAEHRKTIIDELKDDPNLSVVWDIDGTFVANWKSVGVSFFRLEPHPLILKPEIIGGINVAQIEEIGAMKLGAILSRGTRKDYIDLYFILQHKPIERLFEVSAKKYPFNSAFSTFAIRALDFFEDVEAKPMPEMIYPVKWERVKSSLEKTALDVGRQKLRIDSLWKNEK